jgi:hypothetical protein
VYVLTPQGVLLNAQAQVVGQILPDGRVINGAGEVAGVLRPDGAVVDPSGQVIGTVQPQNGTTAPGPAIGAEGYPPQPAKKSHTGLIVGGLVALTVAAVGVGVVIYKSQEE